LNPVRFNIYKLPGKNAWQIEDGASHRDLTQKLLALLVKIKKGVETARYLLHLKTPRPKRLQHRKRSSCIPALLYPLAVRKYIYKKKKKP